MIGTFEKTHNGYMVFGVEALDAEEGEFVFKNDKLDVVDDNTPIYAGVNDFMGESSTTEYETLKTARESAHEWLQANSHDLPDTDDNADYVVAQVLDIVTWQSLSGYILNELSDDVVPFDDFPDQFEVIINPNDLLDFSHNNPNNKVEIAKLVHEFEHMTSDEFVDTISKLDLSEQFGDDNARIALQLFFDRNVDNF